MKHVAAKCLLLVSLLLAAPSIFAVDGQVLINESTVAAAGGYPYRIVTPGSYKLSGNLTATPGIAAIQIEVSDVTLDLNGFRVLCTQLTNAINFSLGCISDNRRGVSSVTVRNGSVSAFTTNSDIGTAFVYGIDLSSSSGTLVEEVHFDSAGSGFRISGLRSGVSSIVRHNTFSGNASPSLTCPSLIEGNVNGTSGAGSSGTGCIRVSNVGLF